MNDSYGFGQFPTDHTGDPSGRDNQQSLSNGTVDVERVIEPPENFTRFTLTVDDALFQFSEAGIEVSERTIQRHCGSGKLKAVKVDPETRQPTDREPTLYLIDATSVATRIAQLKKTQAKAKSTVSMSMDDNPSTGRDDVKTNRANDASSQDTEGSKQLTDKIQQLEIDKAVREQMISQLKDDRKELIDQMQGFVDRVADQAQIIGKLQEKVDNLQLSPPRPETKTGRVENWEGENPNQSFHPDGV